MKTNELRAAVELVLSAAAASTGPIVTEQQLLRELIGGFGNTGVLGNVLVSVPGLQQDAAYLDRLHQRFREDLQAFIDGELTSSDRKRIYATADQVLMVPRTADGGAVRYQYLPLNVQAALAHAVRLLLDPVKTDHGRDLKQCQWKDCNRIEDARQLPHVRRFFFVSERREAAVAAGKDATGAPPDRYCCEEHMRDAHRVKATEATLRRRKVLRDNKAKKAGKHR